MSEFGGKTISGDINRFSEAPPTQADPQLFLDALDKALDTPGIQAVRWNQYTPYFNDGDACTFGIYGSEVKVAGVQPSAEYGDTDEETTFLTTYDLYEYDPSKGNDYDSRRVFTTIGAGYPSRMIFDALEAFERVLESGEHFVILNEKFGDPAQVTATKDGFEVEYYEHD